MLLADTAVEQMITSYGDSFEKDKETKGEQVNYHYCMGCNQTWKMALVGDLMTTVTALSPSPGGI